jgi:hypothetical protein
MYSSGKCQHPDVCGGIGAAQRLTAIVRAIPCGGSAAVPRAERTARRELDTTVIAALTTTEQSNQKPRLTDRENKR